MSEVESGSAAPPKGLGGRLTDTVINSPFAGILPWIVMSVVSGPGRFEIAVALAFGLSLMFLLISHRGSQSIKPMEVFDLVFFAGFFILGLVLGQSFRSDMEQWGGEISNVVLMLFVLISIVIRRPFTLPYAKEQTPQEYWDTKPFLRINYAISWAWLIAFAVQTAMGWYADFQLDDSNELWWGWVLPFAPMVAAIVFTEAYPDFVRGKAQGRSPSVLVFFEWIPAFVVVCGVIGLLEDAVSTTVGIVLIVAGAIVSGALNRRSKASRAAAA